MADETGSAETETKAGAKFDEQRAVTEAIDASLRFVHEELGPDRVAAAKLYAGEKFGNEEKGRSQYVSRDVRDGIAGVLPSLMRIFFGPQRIAEFRPLKPGQEAQARSATLAVEEVFLRKSRGFLESFSVIKDALIKRIGIFKWGFDEERTEEQVSIGPLPPDQAAVAYQENPDLEVKAQDDGAILLTGTRVTTKKTPWVMAVPPEEFIWSREARTIDDALLVGMVTDMRNGDLVALGIPAAEVEANKGTVNRLKWSEEAIQRTEGMQDSTAEDPDAGKPNDKTSYFEGYMRLPTEGGKLALFEICALGPQFKIVKKRPASQARFAVYVPDPEPHSMLGWGWADLLADVQKYRSSVIRGINDSLALVNDPRTEVVEGEVNMQDVMNPEIGSIIRVRRPGMMREVSHAFVGKEGLMVNASIDDIVHKRTGKERGAMSLDAKSLQSSTEQGVQAVVSASQEPVELLARLFSEMTFKPLLKGILKMLHEEQMAPMTVPVGGEWKTLDPSTFDPEMDVEVDVALGADWSERRKNGLLLLAAKQEQWLKEFGLGNPLTSVQQYRFTIAKAIEYMGLNPEDYVKPIPEDWQPPPPQPPPPSEAEILAKAQLQIEDNKVAKELEIKEAELALKREETAAKSIEANRKLDLEREMARERLAMERETAIEKANIDAAARIRVAQIDAEVARDKMTSDAKIATLQTLQDKELREKEIAAKPAAGASE